MIQQNPLRIGASYYPEHWPRPRWHEDFALMREAGLDTLRIGEFAWSNLQPSPDCMDWEWLDQFMDDAQAHGLNIILCTPSACPPPWLVEAEPDLLPELPNGQVLGIGSRRHYSPFHLGYRQRAVDFAGQLAKRYGAHPALVGWQVDNELCGATPDTGPLARAGFQEWLCRRFHNRIEHFCASLGLAFWSQRYNAWEQVPVPVRGHHHPGLRLLFAECSSDAWIAFCAAQVRAIKAHATQPVTTNCHGFNWGMDIDWQRLVQKAGLDVLSFDNYATSRHEGCFYHDIGTSLGVPYWITEQQCGLYAANYQWPEDPERVRSMAVDARAHGAQAIIYFPWRQVPCGQEQEHGAIIDHHGRPGLQFERVQSANKSLRNTAELPTKRIGLVCSWADSWAWKSAALPIDYQQELIQRCYQGCQQVAERLRIVCQPESIAAIDTLVLPLKCLHDAQWESAILELLARGGRVIAFPHTFARDANNGYRSEYLSEDLMAAFGLDIERRVLPGSEVLVQTAGGLNLGLLLEVLSPSTATVIDHFIDGPDPAGPALCAHTLSGGGEAWYCAGYPDAKGFAQLLRRVLAGIATDTKAVAAD